MILKVGSWDCDSDTNVETSVQVYLIGHLTGCLSDHKLTNSLLIREVEAQPWIAQPSCVLVLCLCAFWCFLLKGVI